MLRYSKWHSLHIVKWCMVTCAKTNPLPSGSKWRLVDVGDKFSLKEE